ncbi:MAG: RNA polymerase sigma factor [Anaerolineaceae bacterium]|nr:RNA polymerase sigma factor [Anaerolineaceae bacterium]
MSPSTPTPPPTHAQDLALARRIAAGDEAALEAFFERVGEPLYAYIYHQMGGPAEEVEEVWQESLSSALHGMAAFNGHSRLFTWLCAIATHKAADALRRRGAECAHTAPGALDDLAERLADHRPLPEEVLLDREVRQRVAAAMSALPGEYRLALTARYVEGRSVAEVARGLGRSYKAAESLLERARRAFQAAFLDRNGEK